MPPRHCLTHRRLMAFTLVELLVAIGIIAVLVAILVPAIGGARASARRASTSALMTSVANAINQFKTQNGRLPGFFSQHELGQSTNNTGFTTMENALLDLAGGLDPTANPAEAHTVEITIGGKTARINTLKIGASEGPGFLAMTAKGVGSNEPQASGLAPARWPNDQEVDSTIFQNGAKYQIPDILDSWGKPIILWARNEAAGSSPPPAFALVNAPATPGPSSPPALFYWRANRGYLATALQQRTSALGQGVAQAKIQRTMAAVLGDPAFPNPTQDPITNPNPTAQPVPLSPRGDFVLQSAGGDGVFVNNAGQAALEFRYLPAGLAPPASWGTEDDWLTLDRTDDVIQAGG